MHRPLRMTRMQHGNQTCRNAADLIAKSFLHLPTYEERCKAAQIAFELGTPQDKRQNIACTTSEAVSKVKLEDRQVIEDTQCSPTSCVDVPLHQVVYLGDQHMP